MLFNSHAFIFFFLPVVFLGFFAIARHSHQLAALWLAGASLFFYGWWNPQFVLLLLASICFNYAMGYAVGRLAAREHGAAASFPLLVAAVTANLLLLGYFKYANFFLDNLRAATGSSWHMAAVILPLGISFFTFTQIAFLVDVHRKIVQEYRFVHYLLFVSYFPHLIAGPLLHHKQMMPQFAEPTTYRMNPVNIAVGITIFAIGLFKKVVIADQLALYANPIFDAVAFGGTPRLIEAWVGALAYTLQLYFDFSGYSDMAIGLSCLFNVRLPLNFASPYKAASIIEFWRRWHMTLSAFLRDYLYIPLGGNRHGTLRRYINLLITMLLGGLWHGAGWTFVFWGGLHGIYLVINHLWRIVRPRRRPHSRFATAASALFTFCLVVIAWVPFRSTDLDSAMRMLSAMGGLNGLSLPQTLAPYFHATAGGLVDFGGLLQVANLSARDPAIAILLALAIVWGLPNTQTWLANYRPVWDDLPKTRSAYAWRPTKKTAIVVGTMLAFAILCMTRTSQFLYFRF